VKLTLHPRKMYPFAHPHSRAWANNYLYRYLTQNLRIHFAGLAAGVSRGESADVARGPLRKRRQRQFAVVEMASRRGGGRCSCIFGNNGCNLTRNENRCSRLCLASGRSAAEASRIRHGVASPSCRKTRRRTCIPISGYSARTMSTLRTALPASFSRARATFRALASRNTGAKSGK